MSATVITFPGAGGAARPRPACTADLASGEKALVVTEARGQFTVTMQPTTSKAERQVRKSFRSREQAFAFARRMSATFPQLYRLIVDETSPQTRWSIDDFGGAE